MVAHKCSSSTLDIVMILASAGGSSGLNSSYPSCWNAIAGRTTTAVLARDASNPLVPEYLAEQLGPARFDVQRARRTAGRQPDSVVLSRDEEQGMHVLHARLECSEFILRVMPSLPSTKSNSMRSLARRSDLKWGKLPVVQSNVSSRLLFPVVLCPWGMAIINARSPPPRHVGHVKRSKSKEHHSGSVRCVSIHSARGVPPVVSPTQSSWRETTISKPDPYCTNGGALRNKTPVP
ncbi:hypothetical protein K437DRAFT_268195 [Tilletiaria anomala UBC 951]|uniref:Uncharacterized protein n=1 Tax=Tilletiaria anomala (strain ATCC 24038 / CBS 436.72 / UBC 951) TaxID=1037660 RepID=A0A066VX86_TILAU|nr:uncharacterized protein K437DRAFT_268195 [Tilletiaria anomala UBC 951]KDN46111.1 hypothetical protein K437DRAFT_268195 [Tilletiaria anomala UBC 951]